MAWRQPFYERFFEKVRMGRGCWEWQGATTSLRCPHGVTFMDGRRIVAHRAAWLLLVGPIPEGRLVLHKCNNPSCVRPSHLYLGDYRDNAMDAARVGHMGTANRNKTVCVHGHPLTPENTYFAPKTGRRQCRACRTAAEQRRQPRAA